MNTTIQLSPPAPSEPADFPPDVFERSEPQPIEPDMPLAEISYTTLRTAAKACMPLIGLAIVGAMIVAAIMLGARLMLSGFAVAFLMIMFIGMPLMVASITDALEGDQGH